MKFLVFCLFTILNERAIVDGVRLDCTFNESNRGYGCFVKYLEITSDDDRTITEMTGEHQFGKTDEDVVYFESHGHTVKYFPIELGKIFKNLNYVFFNESSMEEITTTDLQQFNGASFKGLTIQVANLEEIYEDLFATMPNLEEVSFAYNKIYHVDDGVFTNLKHLKKLWFGKNSCLSIESIDGNTTAVMKVSTDIERNCKVYEKFG